MLAPVGVAWRTNQPFDSCPTDPWLNFLEVSLVNVVRVIQGQERGHTNNRDEQSDNQ